MIRIRPGQEVFRSGNRSLQIKVSEQPDDIAVWQDVEVLPNARYQLSSWVKTDNVAVTEAMGTTGACLTFFLPDGEGGLERSESLTGTHDWTQMTWEFDTVESNSLPVSCRLGHIGITFTGTAWFDDLELKYFGPSEPAELPNSPGNAATK